MATIRIARDALSNYKVATSRIIKLPRFKLSIKPKGSTKLDIFTDGSSIGNGKSDAQAGAAAVWAMQKRVIVQNVMTSKFGGPPTNNRGELIAIYIALEYTTKPRIFTDSQYAIKVLTGMDNAKINRDLIDAILAKADDDMTFVYVPAHTGNSNYESLGNKVADKYAVLSAKGGIKDGRYRG